LALLVLTSWGGSVAALRAQAPGDASDEGGPVVSNSTVGYIDGAIPCGQLRLRYDSSYDNRTPSRGEFFYARSPTPPGDRAETRVDDQELSAYAEAPLNGRLSLFVEAPVRFLNPTVDNNVKGLGDVNFGFKWAFYEEQQRVLTFQFRGYAPTGDGDVGLGSSHFRAEPALLGYSRLTDRLTAEGEVRLLVPIGDTPPVPGAVSGSAPNFASTVLRYGVGLGYEAYQSERLVVTPVAEVVGWTFLNGKKTITSFADPAGMDVSAAGDTIVNLKAGARFRHPGVGDLYIGYGHAMTGERMYHDIVRAELRFVY
jgi:hypothetical protein